MEEIGIVVEKVSAILLRHKLVNVVLRILF